MEHKLRSLVAPNKSPSMGNNELPFDPERRGGLCNYIIKKENLAALIPNGIYHY